MEKLRIAMRMVPVLDEKTGEPVLDPETNEPMQKTEVDFVGTALANLKVVEKFGEAIKGIIEKVAEKHEKEDPDAK